MPMHRHSAGDRAVVDDADRKMQLDDEQARRVEDCLRKGGIKLTRSDLSDLTRLVAAAMDNFRKEKDKIEGTFRETHNSLRDLWLLAHEDDPPVAQIRARIEQLPPLALAELDRLAPRVIARLFEPWTPHLRRGVPRKHPIVEDALPEGGFREWAKHADGEKLVRAVQVLAGRGAVIVPGRSRGRNKRSGRRVEPYVMNVARGANDQKPVGGRPSDLDIKFLLIGSLADSWERATGEFPERGRSDHSGFGELVHSVFQWLGEPGAEYALRQFWEQVRYYEKRYAR